MAGKGYANPETVAALERANRLVAETGELAQRVADRLKELCRMVALWQSRSLSE